MPEEIANLGGELEKFLNSGEIAMGDLLPSFIAAGCDDSRYLHAIAILGKDKVIEFLRDVVGKHVHGGVVLSDAKIWLLAHHICSSFGGSK